MMMKTMVIPSLISLGILCCACSDDSVNGPTTPTTIKGSGVALTQTRTVGAFDGLVFKAAGDVRVTFGSPQSIVVTVDDNIMPHLETVRAGSDLEIRIADGINASDYDLVVDVTVESLMNLRLPGAGTIEGLNTLQTDQIDVGLTGTGSITLDVDVTTLETEFTGPGTVTLTGTADTHDCDMSSAGSMRAFGLETTKSIVAVSGVGSAEVHVTDSLVASLSGLGSIYYIGNPIVSATQSGLGQVVDAN